MIVLGIESSCDDTGIAIVTYEKKILANIVKTQLEVHAPYQGVVPEIAARAHMQVLQQTLDEALSAANLTLVDVDAIAATSGPGLIGGVIVGSMFAKALAFACNKPFIAINHLEGHLLSVRLAAPLDYPYLMLLASGGHCQFVACLALGKYKILGETLDDAVGEAFDKTAKILGLGYPGGPAIEKLAKTGDAKRFVLPKPLIGRIGCDFSFSGLKTAVAKLVTESASEDHADICASFQKTISDILINRTANALEIFAKISASKNFAIAGGVAANLYLRNNLHSFLESKGYSLWSPPINLCTDNGAMIAWAGMERYLAGISSPLSFCPKARWSVEEI